MGEIDREGLGAATRLVIVGDGLIGRSVRLAWSRRHPAAEVTSLDRGDDLAPLGGADVVILAAPIDGILEVIPRLARLAPRVSLLMDVGSTKLAIVSAARAAGLARFVGGHPMAGGTTTGPAAARADLFDHRPWFLVTGGADGGAAAMARALVGAIGATAVELKDEGQAHDRLVAAISHLPQLVASALLVRVGREVGADGLHWAGAGLRDTTRLASSSADIWRSIVATNHDALAPLLRAFAADLDTLSQKLDDPEAVNDLFDRAHTWLAR